MRVRLQPRVRLSHSRRLLVPLAWVILLSSGEARRSRVPADQDHATCETLEIAARCWTREITATGEINATREITATGEIVAQPASLSSRGSALRSGQAFRIG